MDKILGTSNFELTRSPIWAWMGKTAKTEAPDAGEDLLEDFSDGLEVLMAVPVWFLSTWVWDIIRPRKMPFLLP